MKKQEFHIYYLGSSDSNNLCYKIVKTYANRFCINEEDQSEIMGGVNQCTLEQNYFLLDRTGRILTRSEAQFGYYAN